MRSVHVSTGALRSQSVGPLRLEIRTVTDLQTAVRCPVWVLHTELRTSPKIVHTLSHGAVSPDHSIIFLISL